MKLPIVLRQEYERKIAELIMRQEYERKMSQYEHKIFELEKRIKDLERHFVTKRDHAGTVIETLADVPVERRGELKQLTREQSTRGMSWKQRQEWLERTDGGRRI